MMGSVLPASEHRFPRIPRRRPLLTALLWWSLALGCAGPALVAPPVVLEGRVSRAGVPAQGADVLLFPVDGAETSRALEVARSGADGSFRLAAPTGKYLLLARSGATFGYFGRNPIHLTAPQRGLHLPLVPEHPSVRRAVEPGREGVSGRVLREGLPVPGARVSAYLNPGNGLRGPGYETSEPADAEGRFELPLSPGTYYLAARARNEGAGTGPLHPGDLFGVLPELPLALRAGETITVQLEVVALPDRERMQRFEGRFSTLSGRVLDEGGHPVAGVRACLYAGPTMINQPVALSEPTGPDGTFVLKTTLAGAFYLGARERLGGPPVPGERIGFLKGRAGGALELAPGKSAGDLVIVLQEVP